MGIYTKIKKNKIKCKGQVKRNSASTPRKKMNSTLKKRKKKERKSDVLFSGKKEKKNTTWCHISVFSVHILAFLALLALMVSIWVIFPLVPAFHHWLTLRMRRHTGKINIQTKTGHTHSYTQRKRDARYENLGVLTATGKPPTVNEIFTTALSSALFITQDLLLQLSVSYSNLPLTWIQHLTYQVGQQTE